MCRCWRAIYYKVTQGRTNLEFNRLRSQSAICICTYRQSLHRWATHHCLRCTPRHFSPFRRVSFRRWLDDRVVLQRQKNKRNFWDKNDFRLTANGISIYWGWPVRRNWKRVEIFMTQSIRIYLLIKLIKGNLLLFRFCENIPIRTRWFTLNPKKFISFMIHEHCEMISENFLRVHTMLRSTQHNETSIRRKDCSAVGFLFYFWFH